MLRRFLFSVTAVAALSFTGVTLEANAGAEVSADVKVAPIPAGVNVVTTEQLKGMIGQKDVFVYDSRSKDAYDKAHVDGAISLPLADFDASKLPADKASKLVFYCGGLACTLAPASAEKAKNAGYTNVYVFHEGIAGWNKAQKKS